MTTDTASEIRTWAQQQGLTVSDRGRLPQDVVTAYEQAHAKAKPTQAAPGKTAKATRPVSLQDPKTTARTPARGTVMPAPVDVTPAAPATPANAGLEKRVAELEKQVLSLTERLDAAVTALTKRSRSFSLPRRK